MRLLGLVSLTAVPLAVPARARASDSEMGADVKSDARSGADDVKRGTKKAVHRVDEAGCTASKAECAKRKAAHRGEEAKDYVSDKTHETGKRIEDETK